MYGRKMYITLDKEKVHILGQETEKEMI